MAKKTQTTWKYAHKFYGKRACISGLAVCIVTSGLIALLKGIEVFNSIAYILIAMQAAVPIIIFFLTERKLRQTFTEEGVMKGE